MDESERDAWFRQAYVCHHGQIVAYLMRRSSPDPEAAAAEVFLTAWRRRSDLVDKENLLPWLYGTAARVLKNQRRSSTRFQRLVRKLWDTGSLELSSPDSIVIRREEDRAVIDALGRLRPADREVILLSVWEELPRSDVAEVLGCSEAATTMRLRRAVDRLGSDLIRCDRPSQQTRTLAHEQPRGEAAHE